MDLYKDTHQQEGPEHKTKVNPEISCNPAYSKISTYEKCLFPVQSGVTWSLQLAGQVIFTK